MFSEKAPLYYVKAKDGKMEVYAGKDEAGKAKTIKHDYVTGRLNKIEYSESQYNNETIKAWKLYLKGESGTAVLTLSYSSGFTRSVFNSLSKADLNLPIRFGCYVKNDYNTPSLSQNGEWLKWQFPIEEVPKTSKVKVGSKEVVDDAAAVAWTEEVVKALQAKLSQQPTQSEAAEEVFGEAPAESELDALPF